MATHSALSHSRIRANTRLSSSKISCSFPGQCSIKQFIHSKEKETSCKISYPTKKIFGYYMKCTGHGTESEVVTATEKWGRNVFEYPQPTFQKLMKENCMEPFFVFRVFCAGLWCLDEYWYYNLFTLFMLFMFVSTMVKTRLKTLTVLRRVRVDNQTVMVHRCGKWVKLFGTDLLPGDVVSIGRSSGLDEDKSVPADMLLLTGSAIVNEVILTGESTPQWKTSIVGRGAEEKLSSKRDKNHILFGGTKILQHTPDKAFPLKTPDGGCLAIVMRTGFQTSQGKLMRTILFSTERVTANSWESGLVILFLVPVIAAGYVLKKRFIATRKATVCLQSLCRGKLACKQYEQLRKEAAAVKIQKHIRRYGARQKYKQLHISTLVLQTTARSIAARNQFRFKNQTKAAIKIQARWRCHKASSYYKRLKRGSIFAQTRWRGRIAKRDLRKLKMASIKLLRYSLR